VDEATSAEELNELGIELVDRYEQEGDPALLRRAREAHEQALRKAGTASDRAAYLNNVGNCLRLEYWETQDPAGHHTFLAGSLYAAGQSRRGAEPVEEPERVLASNSSGFMRTAR
jgi:hypothetical protein